MDSRSPAAATPLKKPPIRLPGIKFRVSASGLSRFSALQVIPELRIASEYVKPGRLPAGRPTTPNSDGPMPFWLGAIE